MPSRPVYRVTAAGLDPRDVRLIEIVFKHSQYNRFEFLFEPRLVPETVDILIVNPVEAEGLRAVARLRTLGRDVPVISAVPRGATSSARHAISIDRLTLQLLPILNRVVEMELLSADARPASPAAAAPVEPARPSPAAHAGAHTRDFLREAGRLSREGDNVRQAAEPGYTVPMAPEPQRPPPGFEAAGASMRPEGRAARPAAEPPSNLVAFPLTAEAGPPRVRVLVVDDSPTVRRQLSIAFARMGADCDAADSAAQALQWLSERHYDLALVDVVMPEMDGYKLTRQIRRRHRATPVIILTSRSSPFDLARGALAGCSTYLVKPVTLKQLEAAVVKQLRRSLAIDDLGGLLAPLGNAGVRPAPAPARPQSPPQAGDDPARPRSAGQ
ncbi:MAG: response regulator [Burkholderiaceae bacterium]|nr:response regulator [Burkholderiaceae bacterium]